MDDHHRSMKILAAALLIGILADSLLRTSPWGINVPLVFTPLGISLFWLLKRGEQPLDIYERSLLGATLTAPWLMVWRASIPLSLLALWLLLVGFGTLHLRRTLHTSGLVAYALSIIASMIHGIGGTILLLFNDVSWDRIAGGGRWRGAFGALRGTLIALPIVIVFGALFASADEVFHQLMRTIFYFDLATLFGHLFWIGFFTWIVAGYIRGLFSPTRFTQPWGEGKRPSLGSIEIGTILGLLNLLFLIFVVIQIEYLLGGSAFVRLTPGLTYAEYARSGFFELVAVVALLLPLLLVLHYLVGKDRIFTILSSSLIGLLAIVIYSGIHRMLVYVDEFGLTELRFYTTGFMLWLAGVFIIFILTVLRGKRQWFTFITMFSGFAAVVTLFAVNPDASIASLNLQRGGNGKPVDLEYMASLSDDAIPTIVQGLHLLGEPERAQLINLVHKRQQKRDRGGWRSWNIARMNAVQALTLLPAGEDSLQNNAGNQ